MLLALGASALGGMFGARNLETHEVHATSRDR
jgi:hypothetical protein